MKHSTALVPLVVAVTIGISVPGHASNIGVMPVNAPSGIAQELNQCYFSPDYSGIQKLTGKCGDRSLVVKASSASRIEGNAYGKRFKLKLKPIGDTSYMRLSGTIGKKKILTTELPGGNRPGVTKSSNGSQITISGFYRFKNSPKAKIYGFYADGTVLGAETIRWDYTYFTIDTKRTSRVLSPKSKFWGVNAAIVASSFYLSRG